MKLANRSISAFGIFISADVILLSYLFAFRYNGGLPTIVFWIAVLVMVSTILLQSIQSDISPRYSALILFEIVLASLSFHLIYQIPYSGLRGSDIYFDLQSTKGILNSGFVLGNAAYANETSFFPALHIFGSECSLVLNVDILVIAKWIPSIVATSAIPVLYVFIIRIFRDTKIALLSSLLFATLQHQMLFSSLYVRETIAIGFAICCLFFVFKSFHDNSRASYLLSIVLLGSTVFAHHLTSFLLVLVLAITPLLIWTVKSGILGKKYFGRISYNSNITQNYVVLAIVLIGAYWIYVVSTPFYTLVEFIQFVFNPSPDKASYLQGSGLGFAAGASLRANIIILGFFFFTFVFSIIMIIQILVKRKDTRLESYTFTLFLFACGLIGLISLFFLPHGSSPFPDRFLMFGWLLGFAPLVLSIMLAKKSQIRRSGIALLFFFIIFNFYMIEPTTWDPNAQAIPMATSESDYAIAKTINFSQEKVIGDQNSIMAIFDVQNTLGSIYSDDVDLGSFRMIIINKELMNLEESLHGNPQNIIISELLIVNKGGGEDYEKILDSSSHAIYINESFLFH